MSRPSRWLLPGAVLGLLVLAGTGRAFEVLGKIIKVDAAKGVAVVFAGGQERTVRVARDVKVLDEKDRPLADGLKSKALKEGAEVTLTVEPGEDRRPTITGIRLGRKPGVGGGGGGPPPRVDTSSFKPLPELGAGEYKGFQGGFYPGGKNERPRAHEAAGVALAKQVRPLDAEGKPSADGKIVVMSVGMSNTNQSWAGLMRVARDDSDINPHVKLVNGAQGGMTAAAIQQDTEGAGRRYWERVDEILKAAGVTRAQVQAAWIKQADAGPSEGFPGYARKLEGELANIVRVLHRRFPNLKLVYLSSRTYGGYAKTRLNPEPYAYESGFAVKWLIEKQINGEPGLNYDARKGKVSAPWMSWGPYLWANASTKRADGFAYEERDFAGDGTHQSASGQAKVGKLLLQFFKTDSTTRPWFVKGGGRE
jgi:hypothetical protein